MRSGAQGFSTVGLLATAYTMEQDFYTGRLRDTHGLTVLVPGASDRRLVHTVIYDELCLGVISEQSRGEYRRIMHDLADRGRRGHSPRLHRDRPPRQRHRLTRARLRHDPPTRRTRLWSSR